MSETTESTTEATATESVTAEAATVDAADPVAEAEKWKALAQKHEKAWRSRAGDLTPDQFREIADKAKRFDEFEESQKSEIEKLADRAAKAEAKAAEVELRALKAEVAAEKGVPTTLLSGSTLEELTAAADALLAFRGVQSKPDFGGGDRGGDINPKGGQVTRDDMKRMTPEQIVQAEADGRLSDLLKSP